MYVSCQDGWLYVFDDAGMPLWSYDVAGSALMAIDGDGTAYAASRDSRLYALGPGSQMDEFTASGQVKDEGGVGLPGVTVTITGEEPVLTDAGGNWSKSGLTAGSYLVACTRDGYEFEPALAVVDVADGDALVPDFTGAPLDPPVWPMEGLNRAHTRRSPHSGPDDATISWTAHLVDECFSSEPVIGGDGAIYLQSKSAGFTLSARTAPSAGATTSPPPTRPRRPRSRVTARFTRCRRSSCDPIFTHSLRAGRSSGRRNSRWISMDRRSSPLAKRLSATRATAAFAQSTRTGRWNGQARMVPGKHGAIVPTRLEMPLLGCYSLSISGSARGFHA